MSEYKRPERVSLMGLDVDVLTLDETLDFVQYHVRNKIQIQHSCVNANSYYILEKDPTIAESINSSELINSDGQAVVWASKILGYPLPERISGIDLMDKVLKWAFIERANVYLLGAETEIVKAVNDRFDIEYPGLVVGYRNGFFEINEEAEISRIINESGASIVFVATPSPMKENFLARNRRLMPDVYLLMGVGGSFDVISGKVQRAPRWMQDRGLEWLYRLSKEPLRLWKRYLIGNTTYILRVFRYWRTSKHR